MLTHPTQTDRNSLGNIYRTATLRPQRISARDRRISAIHEAGHVIMGSHVGFVVVDARLVKLASTPKSIGLGKIWVGHTRYLPASLTPRKISKKKIAMFAVAGAVAECCWKNVSYDDTIDLWEDPDAMSTTDWAGCSCEPGVPTGALLNTIGTVFSLFDRQTGKLWPALSMEARSLIIRSRET